MIKNKFEAKLYDKNQNPDGVLSCAIQDYYQCLNLDMTRLENMFESDRHKWDNNLKLTKQGIDRMKQTLSSISAEQEQALEQLLNPEKFIKLEQPLLQLRKIDLVGEEVDQSMVNFEWPRQMDLEILGEPEFVRLRSMYFMSSQEEYQPISRVTCIFENGVKSPNIQSLNAQNEKQALVELDPQRPIRKIKFAVYT